MEDSGFDSDSKSNGDKNRGSEDPFCTSLACQEREPNFHYSELFSDHPPDVDDREEDQTKEPFLETPAKCGSDESPEIVLLKPEYPSVQLQKRLERHIQEGKKIKQHLTRSTVEAQPRKFLIPRNRLAVPSKISAYPTKADEQPLVSWESDSEDEFDYAPTSKASDIKQQLIKDGYNLDCIPDDEDLDLIPLKPLSQRCPCCHYSSTCVIQ